MKYWLITDTHLGHDKMLEYCGRPYDFDNKILNSLEKLDVGDILIHLGDVCIGNDAYWHTYIQKLNCRKILIKGNHDKKTNNWYLEHGWDLVCDEFSVNGILFSHEPREKFHGHNLNIHGHFHNNDHRQLDGKYPWYNSSFHRKLSVEEQNYKPILLETFLKQ